MSERECKPDPDRVPLCEKRTMLRSPGVANDRVELPTVIDLGEVRACTIHQVRIAPRLNDSSFMATMIAEIDGVWAPGMAPPVSAASPFKIISTMARPSIVSASHTDDVVVQFSPAEHQVGVSEARLRVRMVWSSGELEERDVVLRARSRAGHHIPEDRAGRSEGYTPPSYLTDAKSSSPTDATDPLAGHLDPQVRFATYMAEVKMAVSKLTQKQNDGIALAKEEVKDYRRSPPDPGFAFDLLITAMNIATAGIGGAIAQTTKNRLVSALGSSVKDEAWLAAVTDTTKDAVKRSGSFVLAKLGARARAKSSDPTVKSPGESNPAPTTNPVAAFFLAHHALADETGATMQETVKLREVGLAAQIKEDPAGTPVRAKALAAAIREEAGADLPRDLQWRISAMNWMSAIARNSLGEEEARARDGSNPVLTSKLTTRAYAADGVLNLRAVLSSAAATKFAVVGASIKGVSQAAADRLLDEPLSSSGIPIAVDIAHQHGSSTILLVDEAGRIGEEFLPRSRASRHVDTQIADTRFSDALLNREALVRHLLSMSLRAHGVKDIETDDA